MRRDRWAIRLLVAMFVFAPSVVMAGPVLYHDDFSNRNSGWPSENTKLDSLGYAPGGYRILIKRALSLQFVYGNVQVGRTVRGMEVQTEATELAAPAKDHVFGVACFSSHGTQGYLFGASPDNGFAQVVKVLRSGPIKILKLGGNGHRVPRSSVRLRAECIAAGSDKPAKLALNLDGRLVISATDPRGFTRFDGIGLFAYSPTGRLDVLFRRIVAQQV